MCDFYKDTFKKETMFPLSDAGQPGTEIFNMPASTTAGNLFKPHQLFNWFQVRRRERHDALYVCM